MADFERKASRSFVGWAIRGRFAHNGEPVWLCEDGGVMHNYKAYWHPTVCGRIIVVDLAVAQALLAQKVNIDYYEEKVTIHDIEIVKVVKTTIIEEF